VSELSAESIKFDELTITRGVVQTFFEDFLDSLDLDVAIAGAGPSGLTAARLLAQEGLKVAIFERKLQVGGGIWAGGMLFPRIVVEEEAAHLMTEVGVRCRPWQDGCVIADAVEMVSKFAATAIDAGARIWVGIEVEDVMIDAQNAVCGVVINWGAVAAAGLDVDPLGVRAKVVIDGTGHPAEIARIVLAKVPGASLDSPHPDVPGEASMHVPRAEAALLPNTKEIYPGLVVTGMAANAIHKSPRMGPIFGGMLLSGQKAAQVAAEIVRG
jgi:thiamine thiazole synthase